MVLDWPCPYYTFTTDEWLEITETNPFKLKEPVLNPSLSSSLYDATYKKSLGLACDFDPDDTIKYSKLAQRIFNNY